MFLNLPCLASFWKSPSRFWQTSESDLRASMTFLLVLRIDCGISFRRADPHLARCEPSCGTPKNRIPAVHMWMLCRLASDPVDSKRACSTTRPPRECAMKQIGRAVLVSSSLRTAVAKPRPQLFRPSVLALPQSLANFTTSASQPQVTTRALGKSLDKSSGQNTPVFS